MKIKSSLIAIIILSLFISCNNNDINEVEKKINTSVQQMPENMINLSDRLMFVAQTQAMNDVYEAVMKSMEYGLDETMYIDDVSNTNKPLYKSIMSKSKVNSENNSSNFELNIDGLEVYWPYANNWDHVSVPVVACYVSDSSYIEGDKLKAYKLIKLDDEIMDETIARTAMFTTETQVDNTTYKKSFSKAGVTIGTTCRKIEGA